MLSVEPSLFSTSPFGGTPAAHCLYINFTSLLKVIEAIDADDVREQRIGLSMKLVDQSSGVDLDPSNAEAETEV